MPQIKPDYLVPVVSWMLWHLSGPRGRPPVQHTPEQVLELAANHKQFAGISRAYLLAALDRALLNLAATEKARALSDSYSGVYATKPPRQ